MSDSPEPESVAGTPLPPDFASFQYLIYAGGLADQAPALPVSAAELQERARAKLGAGPYGYVAGGAGSERTMQANLDAFERRRIVPRMLRDVSERKLDVTVLGTPMPAPLMLAPVGVQSIVHPEGELASRPRGGELGLDRTSTARPRRIRSSRSPRRWGRAGAGTSSTGRASASWRRASSPAPSRRATRRSC